MTINIHTLDKIKHKDILQEGRVDPIEREKLKHGDRVVFCAACKIAYLEDSWKIFGKCTCEHNNTCENVPDVNKQITLKKRKYWKTLKTEKRVYDEENRINNILDETWFLEANLQEGKFHGEILERVESYQTPAQQYNSTQSNASEEDIQDIIQRISGQKKPESLTSWQIERNGRDYIPIQNLVIKGEIREKIKINKNVEHRRSEKEKNILFPGYQKNVQGNREHRLSQAIKKSIHNKEKFAKIRSETKIKHQNRATSSQKVEQKPPGNVIETEKTHKKILEEKTHSSWQVGFEKFNAWLQSVKKGKISIRGAETAQKYAVMAIGKIIGWSGGLTDALITLVLYSISVLLITKFISDALDVYFDLWTFQYDNIPQIISIIAILPILWPTILERVERGGSKNKDAPIYGMLGGGFLGGLIGLYNATWNFENSTVYYVALAGMLVGMYVLCKPPKIKIFWWIGGITISLGILGIRGTGAYILGQALEMLGKNIVWLYRETIFTNIKVLAVYFSVAPVIGEQIYKNRSEKGHGGRSQAVLGAIAVCSAFGGITAAKHENTKYFYSSIIIGAILGIIIIRKEHSIKIEKENKKKRLEKQIGKIKNQTIDQQQKKLTVKDQRKYKPEKNTQETVIKTKSQKIAGKYIVKTRNKQKPKKKSVLIKNKRHDYQNKQNGDVVKTATGYRYSNKPERDIK